MHENRLTDFFEKFIYVILMGALWTLTALPVFTIGAATCALNACMKRFNEQKEFDAGFYFRKFKDSFRYATPVWLIHLAALCITVFEAVYYHTGTEAIDKIGMVVMIILTLLILENAIMCFLYLPGHPNRKLKQILKGEWEMGASAPLQSFSVAIITFCIPGAVLLTVPTLIIPAIGLASWMDWKIIPDIERKYHYSGKDN